MYNLDMLNNKKVIGFICECNPFHEGHKRLIKEAKKEAEIIIAVMSGSFVQRGEPAVYDKYSRAKKLIKNGVSLVIELPIEYSLSSAKYFALYSVKILNSLGFVDKLIFGSKINNIEKLTKYADINLKNENSNKIKNLLKIGQSYSKALSILYDKKLTSNDILAVEYICAIKSLKSKIEPISIKRENDLPTASELRKGISKKISNDSLSPILNYKILLAKNNLYNIKNTNLITDDVYNSILKLPNNSNSFTKTAKLLKTKNRTLAFIKRVLLNIIFDINKDDIISINHFPKYMRILGVRKDFLSYLKNIKVPYLLSYSPSSYKAFVKNFSKSKEVILNDDTTFSLSRQMSINIFASNLYNLISKNNLKENATKVLIV